MTTVRHTETTCYFVAAGAIAEGQHEVYEVTARSEARIWGRMVPYGTEHHFPLEGVVGEFQSLPLAETVREAADRAWETTRDLVRRAENALQFTHQIQRAAVRRAAKVAIGEAEL